MYKCWKITYSTMQTRQKKNGGTKINDVPWVTNYISGSGNNEILFYYLISSLSK